MFAQTVLNVYHCMLKHIHYTKELHELISGDGRTQKKVYVLNMLIVCVVTTVYEMSVNVVCACFAKRIPFSGPNIKYVLCLITTIRDEMPQKSTLKQNTKTTMSMRNNKILQFGVPFGRL